MCCTGCSKIADVSESTGSWRAMPVSLNRVVALAAASQAALQVRAGTGAAKAMAAGAAPLSAAAAHLAALEGQGVATLLHVAPTGDALVTTSSVSGDSGDIVLKGSIGPIPYEVHLNVKVQDTVVTLTAEVTQPIHLGPYTWRFNLGGVVRGTNNQIVAATSVTLGDSAPQAGPTAVGAPSAAAGFNFWCALGCAGTSLLPIVLGCLPSLVGGTPAFVACLIAQLSQKAPDVVQCITSKCL
jgi:hypothetical protein